MSVISLTVIGRMHTIDIDPAAPPLYYALRAQPLYVLSDDLELRGPKFGCGLTRRRRGRVKCRSGRPPRPIGKAIFDTMGASVRQVPFAPERVKTALDARGAG